VGEHERLVVTELDITDAPGAGATDIVEARGDEGVAAIKGLTNGLGAHSVVEAVGTALDQTADAYRAMEEREAIKVLLRP
jgi:threonine dehydrogenase-like Zn-dependent dehydrogenase